MQHDTQKQLLALLDWLDRLIEKNSRLQNKRDK